MACQRNLSIYVPYRVLTLEGVCHGIYLVWWVRERHLSPAMVAAMMGFSDLVLMAANVPAGMAADRFGRRASLIAGSAAQLAGLLMAWLCHSAAGIFCSCVAIALGDSFRHGAHEAILHESCRGEDFRRRLARADVASSAGLVLLTCLGGLIAERAGFSAAWAIEASLALCGLAVAFEFREVGTDQNEAYSSDSLHRHPRGSGGPGMLADSRTPGLPLSRERRGPFQSLPWRWIVPVALVDAAASGAGFVAPLGAGAAGTGPGEIALGMALLQLLEGAGAAVASKLECAPERALAASSIAAAAACLLPGLWSAPALYFLAGLARPIRIDLLERHARDGTRATVVSIAGAFDMLVKGCWLPLAAWLSF